MGYRDLIPDDGSILIDFVKEGDCLTALSKIGENPDLSEIYFLEVVLQPAIAVGGHEIIFVILVFDQDTETMDRVLESERGRAKIPRECRPKVHNVLATLTRSVLEEIRPDKVQMHTYETHIPARAFRRYETVLNAASSLGYECGRFAEYHGQQMWAMILPAGESGEPQ